MISRKKLIAGMLAAVSCGHCCFAASTKDELFRRSVEYAVVFAITPDSHGKLVTCVFDELELASPHASKDVRPSETFEKKACDEFSKRNWKVIRGLHEIRPVHDCCFWSKAAPDEPDCPVYSD